MILGNELPKFLLWYCLFLSSYSELKEITQWQSDLDRERNNFSRLSYNNDNSANDFYKSLKDAALLQGDIEGQQNLTRLINNNYSQFEPNLEGGEKQIRSALLTQLRNVAALAGQQVPRFSWQSDPVHFENRITKDLRNKSESPPLVQRNVRESDSALKVAAKQTELQQLLQQLYQAEATVQMEVGEVTRSQQIATEAEQKLEEATNKVRMLSSDLQAAQENAATCAMRAHTAQLQLAAHDQLMFTARQRVDALSAQMVSVQAELASVQNSFTLNESSQHLEQQGRLNNIYQFQSGLAGNIINADQPIAVAPPPPPGSLLIVPPGSSGEQQSYPVYKGPEQQGPPQKK